MKTWRLKKGAERRIRQGHPWVFTGELANSAKETAAGEIVELKDWENRFLAYGYTHPSSQICFRKLSGNAKETDVGTVDFFKRRLQTAHEHRANAGWADVSHRWVYAEGDGLPGLIVDAFQTPHGWLAVVQCSTAGMESLKENIFSALKTFEKFQPLTVIEAANSSARKAEGLAVGEKRIVHGQEIPLTRVELTLRHGLKLEADLVKGQKTGFFLDQQANAGALRGFISQQFQKSPARILDLCCYVGQWSAHTAHALKNVGTPEAHVTLLDSSASALELAASNVSRQGATVEAICGDVMKVLEDLEEQSFDVVISDPPAFVKKKADLENGLRAYVKLNQIAMRLVKPGGLFVASSCSGQVRVSDWNSVLRSASEKAGRGFRQLAGLAHAPDHPLRPEFPEGEYLKCAIGRIDYPF